MVSIDHGMSVSEVEALGHKLQDTYAAQIKDFISQIEKMVSSSSQHWVGKDGSDFRSWWPAKRAKLTAIADDLHGYGQSALNNAHEQTVASGGASGGSPGTSNPPSLAPSNVPGQAPGSASGPAGAGSETGVLPGSHRTWQEVQADYDARYVKEYGLWPDGGPNGDNRYQCVSWAWFRMRELGYTGNQVSAHGGFVAGALGGTTSTVPHTGAVMSYTTGPGDHYGHVAIAEEVSRDAQGRLTVRVSEMNMGNDGIAGHPNEYQASRVFTQNADGTWQTDQGARSVTVFNPTYK